MSRTRVLRNALLAAALSGAAAACTSDRTAVEPETDDEDVVVIRLGADLRFNPSSVTIPAGTTVRWVNDAAMFHTITPGARPGNYNRVASVRLHECFPPRGVPVRECLLSRSLRDPRIQDE
jgi:plastocyanin